MQEIKIKFNVQETETMLRQAMSEIFGTLSKDLADPHHGMPTAPEVVPVKHAADTVAGAKPSRADIAAAWCDIAGHFGWDDIHDERAALKHVLFGLKEGDLLLKQSGTELRDAQRAPASARTAADRLLNEQVADHAALAAARTEADRMRKERDMAVALETDARAELRAAQEAASGDKAELGRLRDLLREANESARLHSDIILKASIAVGSDAVRVQGLIGAIESRIKHGSWATAVLTDCCSALECAAPNIAARIRDLKQRLASGPKFRRGDVVQVVKHNSIIGKGAILTIDRMNQDGPAWRVTMQGEHNTFNLPEDYLELACPNIIKEVALEQQPPATEAAS